MSQPINPIHPSMIARLDAEYVAFHNANLLDVKPTHLLPWDPAIRNGPAVPGGSPSLEVAKIQDFELSKCPVRVFWPKGEKPEGGWSVFIFFHGGESMSYSSWWRRTGEHCGVEVSDGGREDLSNR